MPVQYNLVFKAVHGTENCLYLNVYTPEITPTKLKPVMVWIYGGGYEMGFANRLMYGPDYLIQKDVILVTVNYRVGPLGFLSLKDPKLKIPGNAGLKDQILGLKWVQDNIEKFGGDPDNVTLFGESAGAASTNLLMLSPQSEGLFHKAILMSGSALTPWAWNKDADFAYRLAKKMGYRKANNDEKVLKFLRKKNGYLMAWANNRLLTKQEKREGMFFPHAPVVEPYIGENCVLPKDPILLARNAWSNKIPVIVGGVTHEGYGFHIVASKMNLKKDVANCEWLVPKFPDESDFSCENDHMTLRRHYFGSDEPTLFPFLKEPQPPEPWTQILECTKEASQPVQGDTFGNRKPTGSEDCLYLSVYTKEINPSIPKPVMVWIHGGGFVMGSTSKDMYCPDYLMSKDVVVVSVAYRVGLFGFISLKDPSLKIPGNAGLKDQILGLRWVQKNISKFGGDPNNVTLFGESAGGASVSILAITKQTKGLYHKVIPMSGTSFCFWATPPQRDWAYRIAKNIGYAGPNTDVDVLKFLRSANCYKIAASDSKVVTKEESIEGLLWAMGPVIEPYVTEQCVIPEDPRLMARVAWTNDIPMMIGGTSREGIFVCIHPELNRSIYKAWKEDSSLILPFELQSGGKDALTLELGDRLRKEFFGDGEITAEPHIDISTYKLFWHAIHRTVQSRLKYANAPTYYYNYDFESTNLSLFQQMGATSANVRGVAHGDDLGALFLNIFVSECQPNSEDYKVIKKMVGMWTEFAKKSDPNCEEIKPVEWKPIDPIENPSKLLNISNELTFIDNPFAEKLKVWDSLYGEDELI